MYSKLMSGVAVDRGLRRPDKRSFPADRESWFKIRDRIYEEIMARGWRPDAGVRPALWERGPGRRQSPDAAGLLPCSNGPRMFKTLDAIIISPSEGGRVSNSLVYRYNFKEIPDGLEGHEGTFNMCTFWLVESLTRAERRS